jgi:tRNA threonylcarbamoyladenosine biosynthesis protein TsaB
MILYLDTTEWPAFGLLDEEGKWIDYSEVHEKRNASHIHAWMQSMFEKNGVSLGDIKKVVKTAGPGSYTGVRISDGIGQILEWQKCDVFSFYHFEIPRLLGHERGKWVSVAYKGEMFVYSWDGDRHETALVPKGQFLEDFSKLSVMEKQGYFTHFISSLGAEFPEGAPVETSLMIRKHADKIFPSVLRDGLKRQIFYYRPLEKEFKVTFHN